MRRNQQDELIAVHLLEDRAVGRVLAQVGRSLEQLDGLTAALDKVTHRLRWRFESIGGAKHLRGLHLEGSVRDHRQNLLVISLQIPSRGWRRLQHLLLKDASQGVLCRRNVLHNLCGGPAEWRWLEVPLRLGESAGGLNQLLLRRFEVLKSAVAFGRGQRLS